MRCTVRSLRRVVDGADVTTKPTARSTRWSARPQPPGLVGLDRGARRGPIGRRSASDRAEADRLDIVAEASWWLGRLDDCIDAREQAYAAYEALGRRRRAGPVRGVAVGAPLLKARPAIAGGWLRRARRALESDTESIAYGDLAAPRGRGRPRQRRPRPARPSLAREALALARRLPSIDLEAEALQTIGRILIDAGQLAEGLGHLDEAMLSAVEGRLGPYTTGKVYCSLISACEELGDLRRAAEWTDATLRWAESHPFAMWPGICRVHHAALLQLRGDWAAAEREARRACAELDGFHVPNVAAGYVEIGEIRRRLGDLDGAEEAFATGRGALRPAERGARAGPPRAGPRRRGHRDHHADARASRPGTGSPGQAPARPRADRGGRRRPRRRDRGRRRARAASPPSTTARRCRPPRCPRAGRLQLAQGDASAACATLQQALQHWQQLEVPYEVATARLLLGQACRTCGDEDGGRQLVRQRGRHLRPARRRLDSRHIRDLTVALGAAGRASPTREAEVLGLVASGQTNKEIAAALHLSERTVARHLSNIFTKIGVRPAPRPPPSPTSTTSPSPPPARTWQTPPLHLATGMYIGDNFYHADPRGPDSPRSVLRADLIATSIAARPARRRSVVVAMRWALRVARSRVPAVGRTGCRRA